MNDIQQNTFTGGLDRDTDYRVIPPERYVDAQNVDVYSPDRNSNAAISPLHSSEIAFDIPDTPAQNEIVKLYYQDDTAPIYGSRNKTIIWKVYNESGDLVLTSSIDAASNTSYANLEAAFIASMNAFGIDVTDFQRDGSYFRFEITDPIRLDFTWNIDGDDYPVVVLQDYYPSTSVEVIHSWNVEDQLFVFSGTPNIAEIGIATKASGSWVYTRILRTWRYIFSSVIDARVELVASDKWALYWTDNSNKPKVLYIPTAYTEDCVLEYLENSWTTKTGYIFLNYADQQTNLQLINNAGVVSYFNQLQNGGNLLSGGYRYSIRFGINGTENTTEWSVLTPNVIPVFKTSVNSNGAYIRIQGEVSKPTGKANTLLIENAMPSIFNFVELACLYTTGGATTAYIVNRYDVTASKFTIVHTGNEVTQSLDERTLPQTDPVLLTAKSLEIKKNRLNLANIGAAYDEDLTLLDVNPTANVTIEQGKYEMDSVGTLGNSIGSTIISITTDGTDHTWTNPTSTTPQTGTVPLVLATEITDVGGHYAAGTWSVIAAQAGDYTLSGTLGVVHSGLFWVGQINFYLTIDGVNTPLGQITGTGAQYFGFNTTFSVSSGNSVSITIDYNITACTGLYFSQSSGFSFISLSSGFSSFTGSRVGEYQLPENCANKVGYMLNEKYIFFLRLHYKNGYISSPYFIPNTLTTDGEFDNSWDGSTRLFTGPSSKAYSYYAKLSGIDISSVKDRINGFSIWRAVCNPTVLGTGIVMPADTYDSDKFGAGYYASIPSGVGGDYGAAVGQNDDRRQFCMFFSHDTRLSQLEPIQGDTLRYFQPPTVSNRVSGLAKAGSTQLGSFAEYFGQIASADYHDVVVEDGKYTPFSEALGEQNTQQPQLVYGSLSAFPNININSGASGSMENVSLLLDSKLATGVDVLEDNGVYIAQYIRSVGTQYDIQDVQIVPTGTYVDTTTLTSTVVNDLAVFGGDTYTQKNILKIRYWSQFNSSDVRTSFITWYGQQKVNTQLFYCNKDADPTTYNLQGHQNIYNYLFPFETAADVVEEQFNYDTGYSAQYPYFLYAYNDKLPTSGIYPSRIYYSQQKPINSVNDYYRKILAADYRDLDTKNGEIAAIRDINNYMVAVQPRAVSVLPYLSDVAISEQGGGSVLIGTGGVYNQRENIISIYGTSLQTCVLSGNNNNGNSQLYWYSPDFHKFCRYGADGVKILSDENKMRSFFLDVDVTAETQMRLSYDIRYASVLITHGLEDWTLLYNERANIFSTFGSFVPTRYFQYQNITLAMDGVTPYRLHDLFGGTGYLEWMGNGPADFYVVFCVNKGGMNDKRFISTGLSLGGNYNLPTITVDLSVDSPTSFPFSTESEMRYSNYLSGFKKSGGVQPIGQYGLVKVVGDGYMEILGAVTRFRNVFRTLFR